MRLVQVREASMGLARMHVVSLRVDRMPATWTLVTAVLGDGTGAPCYGAEHGTPIGALGPRAACLFSDGCNGAQRAALLDTRLGRAADGRLRVVAPDHIDAGFRAEWVADMWSGPTRLDLLLVDAQERVRCLSLVLTE